MGIPEWIAVGSVLVTVLLAIVTGAIGWMVSVASNLASINSNTGHLAERIDVVDDACKAIVTTLSDHSERIESLGLEVNTIQTHLRMERQKP